MYLTTYRSSRKLVIGKQLLFSKYKNMSVTDIVQLLLLFIRTKCLKFSVILLKYFI
jgi:hypothetical protein